MHPSRFIESKNLFDPARIPDEPSQTNDRFHRQSTIAQIAKHLFTFLDALFSFAFTITIHFAVPFVELQAQGKISVIILLCIALIAACYLIH